MKKELPIFIVILMLIIITGCGKKVSKDVDEEQKKTEVNVETGVTEDKDLGNGISAQKTNLVTVNGETTLTTKVVNNSEAEAYIKYLDIIFKNEKGEEIKKLIGYVGTTIPAKESYEIITSINIDLSDTKSIEYKINY